MEIIHIQKLKIKLTRNFGYFDDKVIYDTIIRWFEKTTQDKNCLIQ